MMTAMCPTGDEFESMPHRRELRRAAETDDPRSCIERFAASTMDATTQAAAAPALLRFPLEALDGGEIIILAVKPSVLSPVFDSARWLVVLMLLAIGVLWTGASPLGLSSQTAAQMFIGAAALRLVYAVVRWSATWYVLTNRRVLEIHGIRAPRVNSAPLVEVRNTYLTSAPHERLFRLSSITFVLQHEDRPPWAWRHLHQGEDVHRRIRRAIENALDALPH